MLLEKVTEKNNIIEFSDFNDTSDCLASRKFCAKSEKDIRWEFHEEKEGYDWINCKFLEPTEVFEVQWDVKDHTKYEMFNDGEEGEGEERCRVQYSLDGFNWYNLKKNKDDVYSGYTDVKPTQLRLLFKNVKSGFCLNNFKIFGEEKFTFGNELVSVYSNKYYPQRFFEKFNTLSVMIKSYMYMLEENLYEETVKKFFKNDGCTVEIYMIFDEGGEGPGAINSFPINTIPINTGSATTYSGLGAAIINRILAGDSFYDMWGRITDPLQNPSSVGLRFNSTVDCSDDNSGHGNDIDCSDEDNPGSSTGCKKTKVDISYRWEFGDPYYTNVSNNPTSLSVSTYGEIIHNFTMLGQYNISFIMTIDGAEISDNISLSILPSPVSISGPYNAEDGSVYTFYGLTNWKLNTAQENWGYEHPKIYLRDEVTESPAQLIDNGDRTFTIVSNGENRECTILFEDNNYSETVAYKITFEPPVPDNALLDSTGAMIFDSTDEYISVN